MKNKMINNYNKVKIYNNHLSKKEDVDVLYFDIITIYLLYLLYLYIFY